MPAFPLPLRASQLAHFTGPNIPIALNCTLSFLFLVLSFLSVQESHRQAAWICLPHSPEHLFLTPTNSHLLPPCAKISPCANISHCSLLSGCKITPWSQPTFSPIHSINIYWRLLCPRHLTKVVIKEWSTQQIVFLSLWNLRFNRRNRH